MAYKRKARVEPKTSDLPDPGSKSVYSESNRVMVEKRSGKGRKRSIGKSRGHKK